jgi:DNA uptake protein ComE-like DNA-binding protein
MRSVEQEDARIDVARQARAAHIDRKVARLRQEEQRELGRLNVRLQSRLANLVQREQELRQRENAEVAGAEQRFASQITAHDTQLRQLNQAETAELAETLTRRQQQFLNTYLERQLIAEAAIPNIGPATTQRLHEKGIRRAADLDLRRLAAVPGIGEGRAQALVEWRLQVEQQARRAAPQRLSVLDETLIRAKYFGRRIGAERELTRARQQQQRQVEEIRLRFDARRKSQGGRKQEIHAAHQESVDALHRRTAHKEQKLQRARQQAQAAADAEHQQVRRRQLEVEHEQDRLVAELSQFDRTVARLKHLSFGRYVRRVVNL